MKWFLLEVNPEPWAIGPVGYSRRGGKMSAYVGRNVQLDSYKEAIREEMTEQWDDAPMIEGKVRLRLLLWRRRDEYKTPQARTHRKHEADATNMQKALEDALQGICFANDRDVQDVRTIVVEQGPEVYGHILVGIEPCEGGLDTELGIPDDLFLTAFIGYKPVTFDPNRITTDNSWPPKA